MTPDGADRQIAELRERIRSLDATLVEAIAERLTTARRIGELKRQAGLPLRNYVVEAQVIEDVRRRCERHGVDPRLGEEVLRILIAASVKVQEKKG
ncbi:MAG: chorismate mutase [Methanobacteriota archaeon]